MTIGIKWRVGGIIQDAKNRRGWVSDPDIILREILNTNTLWRFLLAPTLLTRYDDCSSASWLSVQFVMVSGTGRILLINNWLLEGNMKRYFRDGQDDKGWPCYKYDGANKLQAPDILVMNKQRLGQWYKYCGEGSPHFGTILFMPRLF